MDRMNQIPLYPFRQSNVKIGQAQMLLAGVVSITEKVLVVYGTPNQREVN
jgi:hypothetical protein